MAANKIPGARAALCTDAETARGARKWNDANILAMSLRLISQEVAKEILSLEHKAEGLIADILGITVADVQGA